MIHLLSPAQHTDLPEVRERLEQLSLAYRWEESTIEEITLQDGQQLIKGKSAILAFLDQLAGELQQWYYCSC